MARHKKADGTITVTGKNGRIAGNIPASALSGPRAGVSVASAPHEEPHEVVDFLPAAVFMKKFRPGEYHSNWQGVARHEDFKKGQSVAGLAGELLASGCIEEPVVVCLHSSGQGFVVEGHHRVLAARKAGIEVSFQIVDDGHFAEQVERAWLASWRGGPIT